MSNAFSGLSLKRNRSKGSSEPVRKPSRLKSGLNIFSKLSDAMTQHQQDNQLNNYTKQTSFIGFLQYFRNDDPSCPRQKATYDSDGQHEYYQYHKYHQQSNTKQKDAQQVERNIHTMPTAQTKKLTGILIKQNGTNSLTQPPPPPPPQQSYHHQPPLTQVISPRSTATHVSASSITTNSEDLTAKEFADIAGIRILSEEEDEQEKYDADPDDLIGIERKFDIGVSTDQDIHLHTVSTTSKSYLDYLDDHSRLSVISYVSIMQSYATNSEPKIWDNEFWLNPEDEHHQYQQQRSSSHSTATHRSVTTVSNEAAAKKCLDRKPSRILVVEPSILHERCTRRNSDKKVDQNSHYVIKKGRFEIHLGDGNPTSGVLPTPTASHNIISSNNSSQQTTNEGVLEWKRKRKD